MKSAILERQLNDFDKAFDILDEATTIFPQFDKLWMMKGQIYTDNRNEIDKAREQYSKGLKNCPNSIPLWILASKLEERKLLQYDSSWWLMHLAASLYNYVPAT